MVEGIHHVTLITRRVQANVDFYAGFLGLRLVKRTGGFEDAEQLHLVYGDRLGSPGSLVTFLVWEDGASGRVGHGQIGEIAFAIPPSATGFWLTRALTHGIAVEGPVPEFGEPVLRLRDPDRVVVKLVGTDLPSAAPFHAADIPPEAAITRLRGATVLTETPDETAGFLARFGYRPGQAAGAVRRLTSPSGDVLDIRDAAGFWPGIPGTGVADHVAFRSPDVAAVTRAEADLARAGAGPTTTHDRKYFVSLYVRAPGGLLTELATDGPGFTVDEPAGHLGETLMIPPDRAADAEALAIMLPQLALPGEPRVIYRDLPFVHRFHTPADPDGSTLVLLHGSGGDEADLMPFAHRVAPRATLLGLRGRSHEEGTARWFRRFSAGTFDQADIRGEAGALAAFAEEAAAAYGPDPAATTWLGYSNGANLLAATLLLHPGIVRRAILIRAEAVLDELPQADLSGTSVLMLNGAQDRLVRRPAALSAALSDAGARLEARSLDAGHLLVPADAEAARAWLGSG